MEVDRDVEVLAWASVVGQLKEEIVRLFGTEEVFRDYVTYLPPLFQKDPDSFPAILKILTAQHE